MAMTKPVEKCALVGPEETMVSVSVLFCILIIRIVNAEL